MPKENESVAGITNQLIVKGSKGEVSLPIMQEQYTQVLNATGTTSGTVVITITAGR